MYSNPVVNIFSIHAMCDEPNPAWSADDHELYDDWGEWDESGQKARVGWLEWSEVDVLGFTLWVCLCAPVQGINRNQFPHVFPPVPPGVPDSCGACQPVMLCSCEE